MRPSRIIVGEVGQEDCPDTLAYLASMGSNGEDVQPAPVDVCVSRPFGLDQRATKLGVAEWARRGNLRDGLPFDPESDATPVPPRRTFDSQTDSQADGVPWSAVDRGGLQSAAGPAGNIGPNADGRPSQHEAAGPVPLQSWSPTLGGRSHQTEQEAGRHEQCDPFRGAAPSTSRHRGGQRHTPRFRRSWPPVADPGATGAGPRPRQRSHELGLPGHESPPGPRGRVQGCIGGASAQNVGVTARPCRDDGLTSSEEHVVPRRVAAVRRCAGLALVELNRLRHLVELEQLAGP